MWRNFMMIRRTATLITLISILLMLSGCATPLDVGSADSSVTPREAAQNVSLVKDRKVAWGGTVVNGKNLANNTQFEVLAYPLDSSNRPKTDAGPLGRFIVVHPGYLETADYAPGRSITVVGPVTETRTGKVGEAEYTYPVVAADRVHLWPPISQAQPEPRIHFGIGIGIIR
jgi:outer membrane lipoprotein